MPTIDPERWRVLSPYLDEALDIPADQRPAWLTAVAARDPSLGADLRTLLGQHHAVTESQFLERAVLDPRLKIPSLAGQVVGAYRLVSHIGQGGTGSVWLAERCDGRFVGHAAVKLLNVALVGRAGEERFRREGTILAQLRHPRIAHLVDAGVSPAGQPYLVLEHVDGQGIDEYCDARALGVEARLRLFLNVLEAVAHAHANLIVHRDIKPANVLVSKAGDVKLLDFGIAKLIERDGGSGDALTHETGRALTPEYAAPEQLSGGTVTTASDVYSLGVLLYLLLTGQHPAGHALRSPATLIQAIVDAEAPRLSDAVLDPGDSSDALTRHARECGGTTPARLSRTLRGDLDTIVAKALKKNPAERYVSVTAFADDVRRVLRHEPISARPDTVAYRTTRFVRRHAGGVVAAAAAVVLMAGLIALHTMRLATERDRAQREAVKAGKASEMLMGLLTSADPYSVRGRQEEPTIRELLDAGADKVQTELLGQPDLQAEMLTTMGRTYRRLGAYTKAQQLLERALVVGQRVFGAEHVRVAETLTYLGEVLADKGEYAAAGQRLEQALAIQRKLLGEHADVAVTLVDLGRVYQDEGWNQRAEPLQREALAIRRKLLGEAHRETAVSLSDLASVLRLNGDLSGAEALLTECLETNRKTRGAEHPNTYMTLHDLALITASQGNYRAAETQLRQVLANQRKTLGEKHPVVAVTFNSLSRVLRDQRRYDEAAAALQDALAIARPSLGAEHPLVGIYSISLGAVHLARKDAAAAEPLLREGLRIRARAPGLVPSRRRTFAEDDWSLGSVKSLLGAALTSLHRYDEAETLLLDAQRDLSSAATRRSELPATLVNLVELYDAWGKHDRAAEYRALLGS
jgi:serine/threonine protein kinase/tetratricopeptide (TPR) repeat protein